MAAEMKIYSDWMENLKGRVLLGCDGFVDEVFQVVDVRHSLSEYRALDQMSAFGELVVKRAGGGLGLEIVPKRRCSGGFTANTGRVAGNLGLRPTLVGLFGGEHRDPAFDEFKESCNLFSLGDPAVTYILEFGDGKVMMSSIRTAANLSWKGFVDFFGEDKLAELFTGVDILGLGYWSITPDFDNFLKGFVSRYDSGSPPRRMFFDFADIKKKSPESLVDSLALLREFNGKIPMTISLNEHEGAELISRYGFECEDEPEPTLEALAKVRQRVGVDELVIHTPRFAVASSAKEGGDCSLQEFQKNVIRTAGAGDSFNGGYLCACLGDLSIKQRLVVANAATAFYVTHATAPDRGELLAQIEKASDK